MTDGRRPPQPLALGLSRIRRTRRATGSELPCRPSSQGATASRPGGGQAGVRQVPNPLRVKELPRFAASCTSIQLKLLDLLYDAGTWQPRGHGIESRQLPHGILPHLLENKAKSPR